MNENIENPLVVDMTDESGNKIKVEIVRLFQDNGKDYVVANDLSNEEDAYIFEVRTTDSGDELISIDSEEEFARLCKVVEAIEANEDKAE